MSNARVQKSFPIWRSRFPVRDTEGVESSSLFSYFIPNPFRDIFFGRWTVVSIHMFLKAGSRERKSQGRWNRRRVRDHPTLLLFPNLELYTFPQERRHQAKKCSNVHTHSTPHYLTPAHSGRISISFLRDQPGSSRDGIPKILFCFQQNKEGELGVGG